MTSWQIGKLVSYVIVSIAIDRCLSLLTFQVRLPPSTADQWTAENDVVANSIVVVNWRQRSFLPIVVKFVLASRGKDLGLPNLVKILVVNYNKRLVCHSEESGSIPPGTIQKAIQLGIFPSDQSLRYKWVVVVRSSPSPSTLTVQVQISLLPNINHLPMCSNCRRIMFAHNIVFCIL